MFVQYAAPGAVAPLFSLRMKGLHFSADEVGWACATQALAALVGPLAAGQVADRWVPPERCLSACGLGAAACLFVLAELTGPWWQVFVTALVFWTFMGTATTLGTALTLRHLVEPAREFGRVRLWGTVGWVFSCWLLGGWAWLTQATEGPPPGMFRLGGFFAVVLSLYCWTLPPAPRAERVTSPLAVLSALRLFRLPAFAVYACGSLGACLTLSFASQGVPLLLEQLGVPPPVQPLLLTSSQFFEVLGLALLPLLILRLGVRGTMLLGLGLWAMALTTLARGGPLWTVACALGGWGMLICCYVVAGQVFVNGVVHGDARATAQALLVWINGVGMLVGNVLAGWIRGWAHDELGPVFVTGAAVTAAMAAGFFVGFRDPEDG
jgi:MFS family permease